jgi:uncharacterized protein
MRAMLQFLLTFAVAGYVGLGLGLWLFQEKVAFPAPGGISRADLDRAAATARAQPFTTRASDGVELYGWWSRGPADRLVLVFHGNGATIAAYAPLLAMLRKAGWDAAIVAYRGYPGSEGSPSEPGLGLDAQAAWDWALAQGYDPRRIVVHGHSLGGGVASGLVVGPADPAGLVLDSTFTSLVDVARARYPIFPVAALMRLRFPTLERAAALGVPVFVMHSAQDGLIPLEAGGAALARAIPGAEYHQARGLTHNELIVLHDAPIRSAWLAWLDRTVPPTSPGR